MRFVTWAALIVLASSTSGMAQGANSEAKPEARTAKAMLPYCMAGLNPSSQEAAGGRCMGVIATLSFVSRVLPDNLKFCHPNAATPEQIVQVIASFAEAHAESLDQDFRLVALAAMRDKWPCQE
jgi:hypothetical protein